MSENDSENVEILEDRFQRLYKEYNKKVRKLQKCKRAAEARAYVQQRLKEEEAQRETEKHQTSDRGKPVHKSEIAKGRKLTQLSSVALKSGDVYDDRSKHSDQQKSSETGNLAHPSKVSVTEMRLSGNTIAESSEQSTSNNTAGESTNLSEVDCNAPEDDIGHENQKDLDISTESQDIFISPLKQVDSNKSTTCLHAATDFDADADLFIVEPKHEVQAWKTEKYKPNSHVSKLKLSKYKSKNFVNPVRKEHTHTEQKIKSVNVDSENGPEQGSEVGPEHLSVGLDCVKGCDGSGKHTHRICEDLNSEIQGGAEIKDDGLANEQRTVYTEGQVIVFEKQVVSENKENRQKKSKKEKLHRNKEMNTVDQNRIASTCLATSESMSISESSPSPLFDNDHLLQCNDSTKTRRRSGSRKRRSSSQGNQRRSSRLAGQSSEEVLSQCTESEVTSPLFLNVDHSSAKKRVIISSVFQCLVDEGRRKSDVEEFCMPSSFLECGLKDKSQAESSIHLAGSGVNVETSEAHLTNVEIGENETVKTATSKFEFEVKTDSINTEPIELSVTETENCTNNSEKEEISSPTLFESQSDTSSFKFSKENGEHEAKCCDSLEQQQYEIEDQSKKKNCKTEWSAPLESNNNVQCVGTDTKESCLCLQQTACFQVPKNDHVQSVLCVETVCNDQVQPYVVCLCSSCLKLYTVCDNQWTCVATSKLGFITRKKSGNVMYCLQDTDAVSVIVLGVKSDCTCINMYTYAHQQWQHITVDKIFSKSIQMCPLSHQHIVVSYFTDEMTYLSKYTLDIESRHWSSKQLDKTNKQITQLVAVKGIDAAVLAITKSAEVQIWNHEHGYLLSTVDISDVCPPDPSSPLAFTEQGFVMLPLLTRKKSVGPGSVVVINPCMSTSEVLTSINIQDTWSGCSNTCVMSDGLLLGRQNNGCVRVWDVYTGSLLATVDDVTVTCFSATNQHFAIAHKQCIHLYKLKVPSFS